MRHILLTAALLIGASAGIARADTGSELFELGRSSCTRSLDGSLSQIDSAEFKAALQTAQHPQAQFCTCVGAEFRDDGDAETLSDLRAELTGQDSYFLLRFMLFDHMASCLPPGVSVGLGVDLGLDEDDLNADLASDDADVIDGDLVGTDMGEDDLDATLADNDFAADEGDIFMCTSAFDDTMMLPGFDPQATLARVRAGGQSVRAVCSCAASYLTSLGEPFQQEVENAQNPQVVYGSALAGGIEICLNG